MSISFSRLLHTSQEQQLLKLKDTERVHKSPCLHFFFFPLGIEPNFITAEGRSLLLACLCPSGSTILLLALMISRRTREAGFAREKQEYFVMEIVIGKKFE